MKPPYPLTQAHTGDSELIRRTETSSVCQSAVSIRSVSQLLVLGVGLCQLIEYGTNHGYSTRISGISDGSRIWKSSRISVEQTVFINVTRFGNNTMPTVKIAQSLNYPRCVNSC